MERSVVISQPRYIPALNYFHRMMLVDHFIFLDNVQYTPRDYENRSKILANEKPIWITIPVIRKNRQQKIFDTYIDNSKDWAKDHLLSLQHAYSRTRYFRRYQDYLEKIYSENWTRLIDINVTMIEFICKELNIETKFSFASSYPVHSTGEQLLIELSHLEKANVYVSGSLGRNYINHEKWENESIKLYFHDYIHPRYMQSKIEFQPWLSVLDLLFHHGPDSADLIRAGNVQTLTKLSRV